MRLKDLPTSPEALGKLLDAVRAYHVHLNERHENYIEIVRHQHARIADAREKGKPPPVDAFMAMIEMDQAHQAHRLDDAGFQFLITFMDLPIDRQDDGPDPARPDIAGALTRAAWYEWLAQEQSKACEAGSSPDAPYLELIRCLELDIIDALDRPAAAPETTDPEGSETTVTPPPMAPKECVSKKPLPSHRATLERMLARTTELLDYWARFAEAATFLLESDPTRLKIDPRTSTYDRIFRESAENPSNSPWILADYLDLPFTNSEDPKYQEWVDRYRGRGGAQAREIARVLKVLHDEILDKLESLAHPAAPSASYSKVQPEHPSGDISKPSEVSTRISVDRGTKAIWFDGGKYKVENAPAFAVFAKIVEAGGDVVPTPTLNALPGCKARICEILKKLPTDLRGLAKATHGPYAGYYLVLPPEKERDSA